MRLFRATLDAAQTELGQDKRESVCKHPESASSSPAALVKGDVRTRQFKVLDQLVQEMVRCHVAPAEDQDVERGMLAASTFCCPKQSLTCATVIVDL